jgi:hypothetical protein
MQSPQDAPDGKRRGGVVLAIRFLTVIDETLWILLAQNDRMSIMNRKGCGRQLFKILRHRLSEETEKTGKLVNCNTHSVG